MWSEQPVASDDWQRADNPTPKRPPANRTRMSRSGLPRAAAALVALAVLAAVVFTVLVTALVEVGVPRWAASPAAVGSTVAATLAAADAFTPLGNNNRTAALRELPRTKLGGDLALAAVVGGAIGLVGAYALLAGDGSGLARAVVLSTAIVAGYATFVGRNLAVYRGGVR